MSTDRPHKAKRDPPAFQLYASDDLARESYYGLSLAERGIFDSIRRVCWVNGSVPAETEGIAIAVRRPAREVEIALTERVKALFKPIHTDRNEIRLFAQDLEDQRTELMGRRDQQSQGARETNQKRWGKRVVASDTESLSDSPSASLLSRDELSRDESSRAKSITSLRTDEPVSENTRPRTKSKLTEEQCEWVADYEREEAELIAHEDALAQRLRLGDQAGQDKSTNDKSTPKRKSSQATADEYRRASDGE